MQVEFNQSALHALQTDVDLMQFIGALAQDVADRANARAEQLFTDRGGGGIGSIESHVVRDEYGVEARIGYPAEFFYMSLHEVGTVTEKPRPHLRPALWGAKRAGGSDSAIRSIRQSKAAGRVTKRNRLLAKERTAAKKAAAKTKKAAARRSR